MAMAVVQLPADFGCVFDPVVAVIAAMVRGGRGGLGIVAVAWPCFLVGVPTQAGVGAPQPGYREIVGTEADQFIGLKRAALRAGIMKFVLVRLFVFGVGVVVFDAALAEQDYFLGVGVLLGAVFGLAHEAV